MKVFISWSGEKSKAVAQALKDNLQLFIQQCEPWVSTQDLAKGTSWFDEIEGELSNTNVGIVCLTKSNMNAPWILFEAGALRKGCRENRLFTLLIDVENEDVMAPLGQLNHTSLNKDDFKSMIQAMNKILKSPVPDNVLDKTFENSWTELDKAFEAALDIEEAQTNKNGELIGRDVIEDKLNEIIHEMRRRPRHMSDISGGEYDESFIMNPINKHHSYNGEQLADKVFTLESKIIKMDALPEKDK